MSWIEGIKNFGLESPEVVREEVKLDVHEVTKSSHSPKLKAIGVDEILDK